MGYAGQFGIADTILKVEKVLERSTRKLIYHYPLYHFYSTIFYNQSRPVKLCKFGGMIQFNKLMPTSSRMSRFFLVFQNVFQLEEIVVSLLLREHFSRNILRGPSSLKIPQFRPSSAIVL